MSFDRWRRLRPRLPRRLLVDPRYTRLRAVLASGGASQYAGVGFGVFILLLVIALVAIFSGGLKKNAALNDRTRSRAALTTPRPTVRPSDNIPGLKPMIVHGSLLAGGPRSQLPLGNPTVLIAVEGGGCRDYSVASAATAFTVTLPGGCAADGARIHFMAEGDDPASGSRQGSQAVCVSRDGQPAPALVYVAGASVEVQLLPGCAEQNSALTFVPPRPNADAGAVDQSSLADAIAPGFPGGVHIDLKAALLAAAPGFPAGVAAGAGSIPPPPGVPPPPESPPPAQFPTPPSLAGVPPPGSVGVTPGVTSPGSSGFPAGVNPPASVSRPPAVAGNPAPGGFPSGSSGIPSAPPVAPLPSTVTSPQTGVPPAGLPAPPVFSSPPSVTAPAPVPPVFNSPPAAGVPVSTAPGGSDTSGGTDTGVPAAGENPAGNAVGTAAARAAAAASAASAMVLDVSVLSRDGTPLITPRVQALLGATVCADETAADVQAASVQLTLPGACKNLAAGSVVAFRAAGFDPLAGPTGGPAPACTTGNSSGTPATDPSVVFQPGAAALRVVVRIADARPPAGCRPDTATAGSGALSLSVTVRTEDAPAPLISPSVRAFVAGKQCVEAASNGSIVAHLSLPAGCGKAGEPVTFEAGAAAGDQFAGATLAPACSFELGFAPDGQPAPVYQPVSFGPGERSVALVLGALPGCPAAGTATVPPADAVMTLRLGIIDPMLPSAPLERPTITALVGGAPCVRGSSIDTAEVELTLPQTCGAADAAISFRVSALDPRFSGGEAAACAIELPAPGSTARGFQSVPAAVTFKPSTQGSYGLVTGEAFCARNAAPTPAPSATQPATPAPTRPAAPSATPSTTAAAAPVTPAAPTATPTAAASPAATGPPVTTGPLTVPPPAQTPTTATPLPATTSSLPAPPPSSAPPLRLNTPNLPGGEATTTSPGLASRHRGRPVSTAPIHTTSPASFASSAIRRLARRRALIPLIPSPNTRRPVLFVSTCLHEWRRGRGTDRATNIAVRALFLVTGRMDEFNTSRY